MEKLGFYPLSVILSFSSECDGTSLLISKKRFAKLFLPLFRLPNQKAGAGKFRHRFQVYPVQGSVVLLQRLNTRRLGKRRRRDCDGLTTVELANREWEKAYGSKNSNQDNTFPNPPPLEMLRFLDQRPKKGDPLDIFASNGITLLVSYPRSGNTLLRTLLERTLGLVTGSDTRPDRTLSRALAEVHNLVGEGVTQKSKSCFVKSHWPERIGCRPYEAKRAVLIVRNPFDAIDSYWNLNATNTHTETVTDEVYERFRDVFDGLVRNEIKVWCKFHRFWLDKILLDNFPLLLVRFEDLIQKPNVELKRILQFSASQENLGVFWNQRIAHATAQRDDSMGSYKPRTATKGVQSIGKSIHKGRYSEEVLAAIHAHAAETPGEGDENLLQTFGYDMQQQNFPQNFVEGTAPGLPLTGTSVSGTSSCRVNSGNYLVRPRDCPFGRSMREWRLQHTESDAEPFPRVQR